MPSRKEAGGALLIVRYEVPLLTEFPFHVMKKVELVQQEDKPLHVKVDRSCLFALDQWNEVFVGSAQDPDVTCPCCGKKHPPGSKQNNDAVPRFFPGSAESPCSS